MLYETQRANELAKMGQATITFVSRDKTTDAAEPISYSFDS